MTPHDSILETAESLAQGKMFTKPNRAISIVKIAASAIDLSGKRIAVVGGTDGLGRAIARLAAERGAAVTVVGRTFRDAGMARIDFAKADLSLMQEAARIGSFLPAEVDAVVLTTGIIPGATRAVSREGIEMDMAVSSLSRHVILKRLLPRALARGNVSPRVFVMGFPGAGMAGKLGDLNSEKEYAGGLGVTHQNTVAANEALVHHWAAQGVRAYGLNPGLIATNIRASQHSGSAFKRLLGDAMEGMIRLLSPSPEQYAASIAPLLVAPELDACPGAMFGQNGSAVLATSAFSNPAYVARWVAELDALEERALAAKPASES